VGVQYEQCPRCHSSHVHSMSEERWEQASQETESDSEQARRDANKAARRTRG
jgi:hypothetical protein